MLDSPLTTPLEPAVQTPAVSPFPKREASRSALFTFAFLIFGMLLYRAYSPFVNAQPTEPITTANHGPLQVDLNQADRTELLQVPGVGPSLADAILSHRQVKQGFQSLDELEDVDGIGPKTMERIRPWLKLTHQSSKEAIPELQRLRRDPLPVSVPPSSTSPGKIQVGEARIDVNTADSATLQRLPGIGATLAARILETRSEGAFANVDELRRVKGIGAKTLEKLRPWVYCSSIETK